MSIKIIHNKNFCFSYYIVEKNKNKVYKKQSFFFNIKKKNANNEKINYIYKNSLNF